MNIKNNRYDVIVIGAGISGLVCANFLAKAGKRVILIEKQDKPGGYCVSFKRKNFSFDICRHFGGFGSRRIMHIICSRLGIYEKLNLRRTNPSDILYIGDKKIRIFSDLKKTKESFCDAFKKDTSDIRRFIDFLSQLSVFNIVSNYNKLTFQDVLDNFFKNNEIKNAFCALLGNAGLGPAQLSAVKGLLLYNQFIFDGGYYFNGGSDVFVQLLSDSLRGIGSDLLCRAKVKNIIVKDKAARGVTLEDGRIFLSDLVVSACDATETLLGLIGKDNLDISVKLKLDRLVPSMSVFIVFLGLKGFNPELIEDRSTIWYLPGDLAKSKRFDSIYTKIYNGEIDLEEKHVVIAPSFNSSERNSSDRNMQLALYVGVPYKDADYWRANRRCMCENIIKRAELIMPGLSDKAILTETATPDTLYRYTLNRAAAMYGWASMPKQIAPDIMPAATAIKRFFMCGHWVTTGLGQGGVMSSAYTGMRLAENILN
jgi:phytoene dehydrogenase-like protein